MVFSDKYNSSSYSGNQTDCIDFRFLRKEKEIAEAQVELIQAESSRYRQQTDYLEKQLQEANKSLAEERQQSQVSRFNQVIFQQIFLALLLSIQTV